MSSWTWTPLAVLLLCCRFHPALALGHHGANDTSALWANETPGGAGCVEEGVAYAEGSALPSPVACEQCFCLAGARRCVRPRCLAAPAGCTAAPAPGVCCPQRYRCRAEASTLASDGAECVEEGRRVAEGEPVPSADCSRCFCLRGAVLCQSENCAPALHGCRPLLRPGHCCPHRYRCPRRPLASVMTAVSRSLAPSVGSLERVYVEDERRALSETRGVSSGAVADVGDGPPPAAVDADKLVPEDTIRMVINGTVNCTAALSSEPSEPSGLGDIITERDSFAVRVSSSLFANGSLPGNASATIHDGDEDYAEETPTLPPSLPNLKIIPFLAADAVLEAEERAAAAPLAKPPPPPPLVLDSSRFSPPKQTEGGFIPKGTDLAEDYLAAYASTSPAPATTSSTTTTTSTTSAPTLSSSARAPAPDAPAEDCETKDGLRVAHGAFVALTCSACACSRGKLQCEPRDCHVPSPSSSSSPVRCGEHGCDAGNTTAPSMSGGVEGATTLSASPSAAPSSATTPLPRNESGTIPVEKDAAAGADEEGFSFGNVLKLLLGDDYATSGTGPPPTRATDHPATRATSNVAVAPTEPSPGPAADGGLLKLAGCNIYGLMYRVGRIIAELSTECSECRCTELGVQCRALPC